MNKLVYVLTLGVAAVAITITTTVDTNTTGTFTDGEVSNQNVVLSDTNVVDVNNTVETGSQTEASIEITDGTRILGTVDTTTSVSEKDTTVDSANVDVTADITAQA